MNATLIVSILIASIIIRLIAFIMAIVLWRNARDWRMGFLAVLTSLMGVRQSLTLYSILQANGERVPPFTTELPGLLVSILIFLTVLGLDRILARKRKALQALRKDHSLLQAIIESTTDAVFVKDIQGRYLMINSAGARLLGKPVKEVIGQDDTALFSPDTANHIIENDKKVRDSGEFRTYEETSTAMGVTRTYLATKGPWRDEGGKTIGLIGIATDVTERKRAEEKLRYRLELEHIVSRISAEFINLPSDEIDEGINRALEVTARFAQANRSSVFLFNDELTRV